MLRCKKLPVHTGKKKPSPPLLLDHPLTALIGRPFFVLNKLLLSVFGPVLLVALWLQWRHARLSKQARYEATLNRKALLWLHKHDDWE